MRGQSRCGHTSELHQRAIWHYRLAPHLNAVPPPFPPPRGKAGAGGFPTGGFPPRRKHAARQQRRWHASIEPQTPGLGTIQVAGAFEGDRAGSESQGAGGAMNTSSANSRGWCVATIRKPNYAPSWHSESAPIRPFSASWIPFCCSRCRRTIRSGW